MSARARVPVGLSNLGRGHQFILRKVDAAQVLALATPTPQPTDSLEKVNTHSWNLFDPQLLLPEPPIVVSLGDTLGHRRSSSLVEIIKNQPTSENSTQDLTTSASTCSIAGTNRGKSQVK